MTAFDLIQNRIGKSRHDKMTSLHQIRSSFDGWGDEFFIYSTYQRGRKSGRVRIKTRTSKMCSDDNHIEVSKKTC